MTIRLAQYGTLEVLADSDGLRLIGPHDVDLGSRRSWPSEVLDIPDAKRLPAQHNRNQAAHLGDRPGEERLNGCETCVKRRTPGLSVSRQWKQEKGEQ